ncbi:hypothetical protein [Streptomyces sp. NPDC058664]|uniref:hypothetical protein n=1 Tax=unclassified Streptomyces TaxID=2593676 RepID=UPI003665040A
MTQRGRVGRTGTLGTSAADCGRTHCFVGLTLLGTDVLERRQHLALLILPGVGENGGGELAADLFLPYDGGSQGQALLAGRDDRAVGGEGTVAAGRRALPRLDRPGRNDRSRACSSATAGDGVVVVADRAAGARTCMGRTFASSTALLATAMSFGAHQRAFVP